LSPLNHLGPAGATGRRRPGVEVRSRRTSSPHDDSLLSQNVLRNRRRGTPTESPASAHRRADMGGRSGRALERSGRRSVRQPRARSADQSGPTRRLLRTFVPGRSHTCSARWGCSSKRRPGIGVTFLLRLGLDSRSGERQPGWVSRRERSTGRLFREDDL